MDRDTVTDSRTHYGVLGVGTLAEAIVTGLCEDVAEPPTIALSPRSASRSEALAERFTTVRVEPDNQAVVDASDVVIVSVRPQDATQVLESLSFRTEQSVVSASSPHRPPSPRTMPISRPSPAGSPTRACRPVRRIAM